MDKKKINIKKAINIPWFMHPKLVITNSGRNATFEEGCGRNIINNAVMNGNGKIVCNMKGKPKKPIFVFIKDNDVQSDIFKRSFLFDLIEGDYIISSSYINPNGKYEYGYVSIYIFKYANKKVDLFYSKSFKFTKEDLNNKLIIAPDGELNEKVYNELNKFLTITKKLYLKHPIIWSLSKAGCKVKSFMYSKGTPILQQYLSLCINKDIVSKKYTDKLNIKDNNKVKYSTE